MAAKVRLRTIYNPDQLAEVVPGASFKAHALLAGPFRVFVRTFDLEDIALQIGHSSPFAGLAAAGADRAILQVPFGNIETLVLNGTALEGPMVGVYGPQGELQRANSRDNHHFTLTFPAELVEQLLEPTSKARLFRQGSARLLHMPAERVKRIVALVWQANQAARHDPQRFEHEHVRVALRAALLEAARGLVGQTAASADRPRKTRARMRVVRAADEYMRANLGRPLFPEQISTALGVSERVLREAFLAQFATSPFPLLERRRLGLVHAEIVAAEGLPQSIRTLALKHGFWNFEKFLADYQTHFGTRLSENVGTTASNVIQFQPRAAAGLAARSGKSDIVPDRNPRDPALPYA